MTQANDSSCFCSEDHSSLSPVLSAYFCKSLSDISFLGCSYKREFCCWNRVRWNHWHPRTFWVVFFFFPSAQEASGSRKKPFSDEGVIAPGSLEGRLRFVELHYDYSINKSLPQSHKVEFMIFILEIKTMRVRNVKNHALGHKM